VRHAVAARLADGVLFGFVFASMTCLTSLPVTSAVARESAGVTNLKALAADGDLKSQIALAEAYVDGKGVKADMAEAGRWFEAAARQGDAESQNTIGALYLHGEGVPRDPPKACEWFAKSAAQENIRGTGNLGTCYDAGVGVEKDQTKAHSLYERAANAGDLQSMLNVGADYWKGEGVEKDLVKAYMWLDLVRFYKQRADARNPVKWRARHALDELAKQITPAIKAEAEALSNEWDRVNRAKVLSADAIRH
jgi:hypothetical protein